VPTYEYACTACDHTLEAVQSFSDAALTVCPECGGALRKVFSAVGVVFKGSGFYKTDSRSSGNGGGDSKKADATSEPKAPAKTETKKESKPAASTPASTPAAS
jgi:putative FmdB family regulatory protein